MSAKIKSKQTQLFIIIESYAVTFDKTSPRCPTIAVPAGGIASKSQKFEKNQNLSGIVPKKLVLLPRFFSAGTAMCSALQQCAWATQSLRNIGTRRRAVSWTAADSADLSIKHRNRASEAEAIELAFPNCQN